MSKERLEIIKKLRETILEENDFRTRCVLAYVFVNLGYMDWLIEQAERVQELEEENRLLRFIAEENKIAYEQRAKQNKRFKTSKDYINT